MNNTKYLIFIIIACLLFSVGCKPKAETKIDSKSLVPANTLSLPIDSDPPSLDPAFIIDIEGSSAAQPMFDTLVRFDKDLKTIPWLAESWQISSDKKIIQFKIKKGVKFHDGSEMTAEDVRFSIERLLIPELKTPRSGKLFSPKDPSSIGSKDWELIEGAKAFFTRKAKNVSGLRVIDPYTFEIKLTRPYGPIIQLMGMINFAVVPKNYIEKLRKEKKEDQFTLHPIGTGPYKFKEWVRDSSLTLEANPDCWRGAPKNKILRFMVMPDRLTQLQEYKTGNIVTSNIPTGQLAGLRLEKELKSQIQEHPVIGIYYLVMNLREKPFKDELFRKTKQLRQSINYSVNREYICEQVLENRYQPFVGIIPPSLSSWCNPDTLRSATKKYRYDPKFASDSRDSAGYPDGMFLLDIQLTFDGRGDNPKIAEAIQSDLEDNKFKVSLNQVEWGSFIAGKLRGDWKLHREGWIVDYPDPDNFFFELFHSSQRAPVGTNFSFYSNPEVDKLIEAAQVEFDVNRRKRLYWEAERIILDDCPFLFLFTQKTVILVNPKLHGVELTGMDFSAALPNHDFSKVWLSE